MSIKKDRAFSKQAGGKYPLLDDIKQRLSQGERLIEPFVGTGSVFLNTDFSRYILADINSDLISLHSIVKTRTNEYMQASRELFTSEINQAEVCYRFREEFSASGDSFRRAVLFLYLNYFGYSGLCHYSLHGELNVPFGCYKKPHFPKAELYHLAEKAQSVEFYCLSYEECMNRADSDFIVYRGPPYAPLSVTASFIAYHTNSFSPREQVHLAEMTEKPVSKQIPVLILNHGTPDTRKRYRAAKHFQVKVQRSVNSNDSTREKVNELLVLHKPGVVAPAKK